MKQLINSFTLIVLLVCTLLYKPSFSQSSINTSLKEKLEKHLEKSPIEKVHLHLDKPYYYIGDDIWFKAYVMNGNNEIPSLTSGILYVDLISEASLLIASLKLPLLNGVTWGDIKIPNDIPEGKYTLFAYTQWMRNASPNYLFKKELSITNLKSQAHKSSSLGNKDVDLQFFPEGGALVEGLPSKVGFKALNQLGLGETISGSVYDNDGIEVLKFESSYLGMGQLSITPQANKTYHAKITLKNNTEKIFKLPNVNPSGYVLSVNTNNPEKFIAKIFTSKNLIGQNEINMVVHHNGKIYSESKVSTEKPIAVVPLNTSALPSGIVEITLLDNENIPLCERIAFINNSNKLINFATNGLKETYTLRSPLDLDVFSSLEKSPLQGSFSISVTNTSLIAVDNDSETHILSSLLLKSDLAGHIEKPNSYFSDNEELNRERIDYLMLTQGWRKVSWSKIAELKPDKPEFDAEQYLKISGVVMKSDKILPNTKVSVISTPNITFSKDTITDNNGRFTFDNLNFIEGTNFIIKTVSNNKIKISIDTVRRFIPSIISHFENISTDSITNKTVFSYAKAKAEDTTTSSQKTNQLKTVEIKGQVNKAPNSVNFNGPGKADVVYDAEDLKHVFSINQFLEGRVNGLILLGGRFYLRKSIETVSANGPEPMRIYVDGSWIRNARLDDFTVNDVESIEILKSISNTFLYGTNAGVILITTKTGASVQENAGDVNTTSGKNQQPKVSTYRNLATGAFQKLDATQINEKSPNATKTLNTVEIVKKANKAPNSVNLNGAGNADVIFDAEDLKTVFSISHFLQGRVSGLTSINGTFFHRSQPMRIYVDGLWIRNATLDDFTVNDVESIEILKSISNTFLYGTNAGIFLITTKAGASVKENIDDVNTTGSKNQEQNVSTYRNLATGNLQKLSTKQEANQNSSGDIKTLNTVEIVRKVNKAPNSANLNGAGKADAIFDAEDLKNAFSLNQFLEGRVSGIHLFNKKFYLPRSGVGMENPLSVNKPQPMRIYVDGAQIDSAATLDDFTLNDIESIEILKSIGNTFLYGTNDGVILITTKTGTEGTITNYAQTNYGMLTIAPQGFALSRQFYSPKYNVQADNKPDYRTTVFWEPNLITDKDGKAKISYYNTDIPGIYRMVIEGLDAYGNLARKVLTYEVK